MGHEVFGRDELYSIMSEMLVKAETVDKGVNDVIAFIGNYLEAEKKKEADKAKAAHEIIQALTRDYVNVYIMNPQRQTFVIEKQDGYMLQGIEKNAAEHPYDKSVEEYISMRVYQADKKMMREALSIDKVLAALEESDEYVGHYRCVPNEAPRYFQFKFIKQSNERVIAAFRNVNEVIVNEIRQRTLIEETLASAEKANKAKTVFLNNMSHDIRTPMNAIVGYTALALSHLGDKNTVNDYLKKIQTSSNHLLSLSNDVLDMSRIEAGKLSMDEQETSLYEIVQDIKSIVTESVAKKNLELVVDYSEISDDIVICDKVRLEQVLLNCVSNAVKFTPEKGMVSVKLSQILGETNNFGKYQIKIADTGIGMSPDFVKHIFEPFERENVSVVAGTPGAGLGMAICKSLVEMMGGEIAVESEKGVGTEFTISLAFKLPEKRERKEPTTFNETTENGFIDKELKGISILVVEDNESNREIVSLLLSELGAEIDTAENGAIAVEKVLKAKPDKYDVVLMDVMMPVMDGLQATKQIRKLSNQNLSDIPIIALTANAFEEDKKLVLEVGMNGHVAKPIDIDILTETIKHVLEKEAFKQMAYRDNLTGLYSRHYITTWVTEHEKKPIYPVTYISIDVNNLKHINDNFGHASGDQLLQVVGELFAESFANYDCKIIRTGGDEFLILCKEMSYDEAETIIERTKQAAAKKTIEEEPITFCSGIVTQTAENYDFDKGVREADDIMMEAKHVFHGRKAPR